MLLHVFLFLSGLLFLYYGAEWLVTGSSRIARGFGIRPLIVGLTVVAFGTSAPEGCVSVIAAVRRTEGIALGNIIGSNIANIGLVLGLSALVSPLKIDRPIMRKELPIMVVASVGLYIMALNGRLGFVEGVLLLLGLIFFLWLCFISARGKTLLNGDDSVWQPENERDGKPVWKSAGMTCAGLLGLVAGSYAIVTSAVFIARAYGVKELAIGMSLVAIGTSLPELATSMVASYRKEGEICVGNVVGSNIFNIFFVLGVVSVIAPLHIERNVLTFHFPIMLLFSAALFPFIKSGFVLSRKEGALLLGGYIAFLVGLF